MATQVDVIKRFVKGLIDAGNNNLTGTSAVDYAIKSLGINGINSYSQLQIDFTKNLQKFSGTQTEFLEQKCGIVFGNLDTGAITGADAGGSTVKTQLSIIPETTAKKELSGTSFTSNGLKVNVTYDTNFGDYTSKRYNNDTSYYLYRQQEFANYLYSWWIPEALKLINNSLGVNFSDGNADTNILNITFYDSNAYDDYYANLFKWTVDTVENNSKIEKQINLKIDTNFIDISYLPNLDENDLTDDDKSGSVGSYNSYNYYINGGYHYSPNAKRSKVNGSNRSHLNTYLDAIITEDLAEILLKANITYDLPDEIFYGLRDLVLGQDKTKDNGYSFSNDNYTKTSNSEYYGYALLRYLAKNYADGISYSDSDSGSDNDSSGNGNNDDSNVVDGGDDGNGDNDSGDDSGDDSGSDNNNNTVNGGNNDDDGDGLIFNKGKTAVTITADYENDYFDADDYDDLVTINASKTVYGIEISGNDNNNSIIGGKGDDTLNGGDGDDTLTGGKGEGTFVYEEYDGNDVITDYKPGEDVIEIKKGAITDYKFKGDDVIFTIGRNTLTVKNGNGNPITIMDENGDTTSETYIDNKKEAVLPLGAKYNANKTTLTLSKKFTDEDIDLSDYADTVKTITATAVKNELTITANENNNKIKVGKKATTVYGGAGNDQITGGAGADALYGEDDDDKLVDGSGADTLFGGDGDDTLTGGAGKDVFVYDGNGDDIITDYKAGQDVIQISEEVEFESVTVKGKNVTFNLDGGKLTIKNAKNKKITFVDEDGEVISEDKYKKSATFDTDDDDDDERDFIESPDVGSGYWFAEDDNFEKNGLNNIIMQTTCSNNALDMTNLATDYSSINKIDSKTFIAQTNNK